MTTLIQITMFALAVVVTDKILKRRGKNKMKDRNKTAVYEITCVSEEVTDYAKEKIALFGKRFEGHPNDPDIIMMEFYGLDYEDIKGVHYRFIEENNYIGD